ncbi:MAG TPA: hypothetical protein VEY05_11710, partial [Beijerinckiaceae bacterium]|nr:hypothetical protein [Beijerinckiaceae bacterium]
ANSNAEILIVSLPSACFVACERRDDVGCRLQSTKGWIVLFRGIASVSLDDRCLLRATASITTRFA